VGLRWDLVATYFRAPNTAFKKERSVPMEAEAVWVARGEDAFAPATILDGGGAADKTVVHLDAGEVAHVPASEVFPRNAAEAESAADLSSLTHLNPPCINHALRLRHSEDAIYTSVGSILVAVNPWKRLPHLTAPETLAAHLRGGSDEPHPYAIARAAYAGVLRGERQSILVSGESGAGKTESTKILLQFLAASAGGASQSARDAGARSVQSVLLDANPILEAFGNAKTLRNHNSSRFVRRACHARARPPRLPRPLCLPPAHACNSRRGCRPLH
jgi:myosin-5